MSGTAAAAATLVDVLRRRAEERPDVPAVRFLTDGEEEHDRVTFRALDAQARAIAAALQSIARPGDRAVLLFSPGIEFIASFLGCLYAGVVAVPQPTPRSTRGAGAIRRVILDARPAALLTERSLVARWRKLGAEVPELSALSWLVADELEEESAGDWQPRVHDERALAFLQYTSGSTADPKGVEVTHGNLLHNQEMIRRAFDQDQDSVIVGWLPLFHDMGLIGNVLQPLYLGAQCILMAPVAFLRQPLRWLAAVSRYRATTSGGPNFAYDLCVEKIGPLDPGELDLSSWRVAFNGAEPVRSETLERFTRRFRPYGFRRRAFYPCFGLAEATLFVAGGGVEGEPVTETLDAEALARDEVVRTSSRSVAARRLVGCGRAWSGQEVRIVDPKRRAEVPPERIGEIWVSGPSVAPGYWGRPEAGTEAFRARLEGNGRDWLRTGDLGFVLDGEVFVAGRLKDVIILRGRNLYPQDLEAAAEASHPALVGGGSAAFSVPGPEGEEALVLVAEVERRADLEPAEVFQAMRRVLSEELEVRLDDAVLIRAGTLPRTTSGKVRRRGCRDAYLKEPSGLRVLASMRACMKDAEARGVGVADPLAAELRLRLAARVGVRPESIDETTSLAALGLDSLRSLEVSHEVERRYGATVAAGELLEGITLTELAERVREARRRGGRPSEPAAGRPGPQPLSAGQRALWLLDEVAGHAAVNVLTAAYRSALRPDPEALRAALGALIERHPALRLSVRARDAGAPKQSVAAAVEPDFAVVDLPPGDAALRERLLADGEAPFDLARAPLFRVRLYRLAGGGCALLFAAHHLICDLWSAVVLFEELDLLYGARPGGSGAVLPEPTLSFPEWAARRREELAGSEGARLRAFWGEALAGAPPALDLPTDRPRPVTPRFRGARVHRCVGAATEAATAALAAAEGTTVFTVLLTVFGMVLARYSGHRQVVVGSPTHGREGAELSGTVGYLVNPLPVCLDLSGNPPVSDLIRRTRESVLGVLAHQAMPLLHLAEGGLGLRRRGRSSPLFQAFFAFERAQVPGREALVAAALQEDSAPMRLFGAEYRSVGLERRGAQLELMLLAGEIEGSLRLTCEYDRDLFDEATVERFMDHFANVLRAVARYPRTPFDRVSMLSEAERRNVLRGWSGRGDLAVPVDTLDRLFEHQARRHARRTAVVCGLDEMTYGELDRRSASLARRLREAGIGPDVPVAFGCRRSPDLVVGVLGVVRAGSGYVPLDPAQPLDRRRYILEDAARSLGCRVLLLDAPEAEPELVEHAAGLGIEVLDLAKAAAGDSGDLAAAALVPDNLAYVIYTSGSTGRPKGVMVTHGNVVRLLSRRPRDFAFGPEDVWTLFHSFGFDFSVWEMWGALLFGGRLVVVPFRVSRSPEELYDLLCHEEVTVLNQTPSAFRQLAAVDEVRRERLSLRWVIFGGEALDRAELETWIERHGIERPRLVNMYGITETTVHVTFGPLGTAEDGERPGSPIGRPLPDLSTYVLGPAMEPMPVGAPGEILVGGCGLARGYAGRPRLTAARFVPDPFSGRAGGRLYRSGDLARWRPRGELDYLGRIDNQVKIRGFRIEIGEVETVLSRHPEVTGCTVVLCGEGDERHLVAYVLACRGSTAGRTEWRAHLAASLPEYMVPAAFVTVEALPLTPNGKVDRKALAEIATVQAAEDPAGRPPRSPTELRLAEIWRQVLGVRPGAAADDFFELGGHSLLNVRMVSRVREELGLELPLSAVFQHSTLESLAGRIDAARGLDEGPVVDDAIEPAPPGATPELSFAQEALWLEHELAPGSSLFNVPLPLEVTGGLPEVDLLQRSLDGIVERHEVLRTAVAARRGRPNLTVRRKAEVPLKVVDLRSLPARRRESTLNRALSVEGLRPFRLAEPPLLRAALFVVSDERSVLLLTSHHFVVDHWSLGLLVDELVRRYEASGVGGGDPFPALPFQYADYARWERRRQGSPGLEAQRRYWLGRLHGLEEALDLPTDRSRPAIRSFRGALLHERVVPDGSARLRELARRHDATLFMVLLAAFKVLLYRWTGETDLAVGTDVAIRHRREIEPLIGLFVNQVVLRTDLAGEPEFVELLARVRETALEAFERPDVPFRQLVERLRPRRSRSVAPLFQVLFDVHNAPLPPLRLGQMTLRPIPLPRRPAKFDLSLFVGEEPDGSLRTTLEYATDLFNPSTARRFLAQFHDLLDSVVKEPRAGISVLPVGGGELEERLAGSFNSDLG